MRINKAGHRRLRTRRALQEIRMSIPVRQQLKVASYIIGRRLPGVERQRPLRILQPPN